jgi:polyribonucleotide nucleotidyltransferase
MEAIKKSRETLIDASKEVGLEVNIEKTKYWLVSHHQNAGKNHDIKIANRLFEKCVTVQIFGQNSNKPNLSQEEIKRRLNFGNACYHSVQNHLSCLLPKNVRIRIFRTVILCMVLYGCQHMIPDIMGGT